MNNQPTVFPGDAKKNGETDVQHQVRMANNAKARAYHATQREKRLASEAKNDAIKKAGMPRAPGPLLGEVNEVVPTPTPTPVRGFELPEDEDEDEDEFEEVFNSTDERNGEPLQSTKHAHDKDQGTFYQTYGGGFGGSGGYWVKEGGDRVWKMDNYKFTCLMNKKLLVRPQNSKIGQKAGVRLIPRNPSPKEVTPLSPPTIVASPMVVPDAMTEFSLKASEWVKTLDLETAQGLVHLSLLDEKKHEYEVKCMMQKIDRLHSRLNAIKNYTSAI
jgi:hypothetical protein